METEDLTKSIQQHANQCVKCGLCLPHCPTYGITQNECESPRGRIALLDALAQQQIPLTDKTRLYLDHCLTCRACEAVCPAKVSYGELIDQGREFIVRKTNDPAPLSKWLDFFLKHPGIRQPLGHLLKFYQYSGLQWLARKSGLLKILGWQRAEALLPAQLDSAHWHSFNPATSPKQGQVALFTGCVNQVIDATTIKAAIKVLTAYGYDVYVPSTQQCCGALHQHAGATTQAAHFASQNKAIFDAIDISHIITITTGCAATLQEYLHKTIDINQFLIAIARPEHLTLKPLPKRVVVHTPCTLRNVLKQPNAPERLLQTIPQLDIVSLPATTYCCGAAGQYMLQHADMADALLNKLLEKIITLQPDYLITSNIGCALHLQKGLRENHLKTRLLHPIVLLAEQLNNN